MTPDEFNRAVDEAKRGQQIVRDSLAGGRERLATDADLDSWEQTHRIALPPSFRYFAKVYGCGDFVFTTVLSVLSDSEFPIAFGMTHVGQNLVPVVDNHCGDYYCLPVQNGRCLDQIVFADHEAGYAVTEDLGKDFLSFIAEDGLGH
jgi:hypothetical protein